MGEAGFEPACPFGQEILSLQRLPFRHSPSGFGPSIMSPIAPDCQIFPIAPHRLGSIASLWRRSRSRRREKSFGITNAMFCFARDGCTALAPEGPRIVATGGASQGRSPVTRNPWKTDRFLLPAPAGRRRFLSARTGHPRVERFPPPLSGRKSKRTTTCPRVSLRCTRGYNPMPRWGRNEHSRVPRPC